MSQLKYTSTFSKKSGEDTFKFFQELLGHIIIVAFTTMNKARVVWLGLWHGL